ncbi:MAG: hypothetical protein R3D27_11850 [Hyphomicrobiaceae bacterium]
MSRRLTLSALLLGMPHAALAHPGTHDRMYVLDLARHIAEPDHLAFAAVTLVVAVLAYRHGRRAEARASAKSAAERHDGSRR